VADIQKSLLSLVVLDGNVVPLVEHRITEEFFTTDENKAVFSFVMEHYRKYGKAPSPEAVGKAYPNYKFKEPPEPFDYYLSQIQQDRKQVILTQAVREFAERVQDDDIPHDHADQLESILRQGLADASHEVSRGRDIDFFLSHDRLMERLRSRRDNPGYLRGLPTGFDGIDRVTGGYQPEQLITLIGVPKAGKSSTLLASALHVRREGSLVLFVTFEMSTEEQEDRLLSLISGVSLSKILSGTFSAAEERAIDKALTMRSSLHGLTITSDTSSTTTVSGVQAKIQQYNPAVVFVDGMYLMEDERGQDKGSPQALTNITRDLKRLAQNQRLSIVIGTQAMIYRAKGGLNQGSAGYSSSFAQDSDILLGIEPDEAVQTLSRLKVLESRSGPRTTVYMSFNWDKGDISEIDKAQYEYQVSTASMALSASSPASLWDDDDDD
jgi:replicative DNA helicase